MANRRLSRHRSTSSEFKPTWTRHSTKRRSTRAGSNQTKNGMQQCGILSPRFWILRRENADLFERGEYLPLHTSGIFAECCLSFARRLANKWIVVVAPRLSARIGFPPVGKRWKDTAIELPKTFSLEKAHDLFTCNAAPLQDGQVKLAEALSILPFGVITNLS